MKKKELISIIIPVYNTKEYIRRCIDSALNQTYKNIEVVVVDDGSNLTTINELSSIEKDCNDKRLRVFYEEHKGCAGARNKGLMEAHGNLIFWLDSDDFLEPTTIAKTKSVMEQENSDMVRIDFTTESSGIITMDQTAYMRLILDDHLKSFVTGTLMKKTLFGGITFLEGNILEDYAIYPSLCLKAKKITLLRQKDLYFYTFNRPGSTTNVTATNLKGLIPRMYLAEARYSYFVNLYPRECERVLAQFTNYACMVYFLALEKQNEESIKIALNARKELETHREKIFKNDLIPCFRKLEVKAIISEAKMCSIISSAHKIKKMFFGTRMKEHKKNG